MHKYVASG